VNPKISNTTNLIIQIQIMHIYSLNIASTKNSYMYYFMLVHFCIPYICFFSTSTEFTLLYANIYTHAELHGKLLSAILGIESPAGTNHV